MTGKTITGYLEEYRVNKSLFTGAEWTIFYDTDRRNGRIQQCQAVLPSAFRKQFGCNPGEYNSLKLQKC